MPHANGTSSLAPKKRECNIHRCRFVDHQPPNITALAFSHCSKSSQGTPEGLLLAVGRSNGDIDIWSPLHDWVHKTTIKGGKDRCIEGLAWIPSPAYQKYSPNRLFSIGSSTYLTEWDSVTGLPKTHLDSNAGLIWSLAPSPDGNTLALGCDDGSVILVDVADGSLAYSRALERQPSRVMCLSWHPNGHILVGGCGDSTLRAWDIHHPHGRILSTMKVEQIRKRGKKRMRKIDTLIWTVKVLSDGTIISGDSTGSLKIWESQFWSLTQSFQVHKADILCFAVENDERCIYSSGVDRKTMRFQRLGDGKWTHVSGKTYHKHDVRAMTSYESAETRMIVSGGVDRTFSVLSFMDGTENLRVLPPVPQERIVKVARKARILFNWSDNKVKLWKIAQINEAEMEDEEKIEKRFLLEMDFNDEEHISTAAISPNGEYLLVSTVSHSKLFALVADELTAKISVEQLGVFPHGGRLATFTPQGDTIILVTPDSEVQIHPFLDEQAPTSQFPYSGDRGSYINKLAVSPDGKTFAISSSSSLVLIQSFDQNIPPQTLPQPSSAITSLAFLTPTLLSVTLADKNRLLLFELKTAEWVLHPWCRDAGNMPAQIGITMDKCLGTFITDEDPSTIWLWGANWLAWIRPDKDGGSNKMEIDAPSKEGGELATTEETAHWITYRYREVLLIDCLSSTSDMIELVVVERPRHEILEDITEPRFYRHEYGT